MILADMLHRRVKPSEIGVITPYTEQKALLERKLVKNAPESEDIEIDTVDAYQAREKNYIVVSTVRSAKRTSDTSDGVSLIGFLVEPRRLNVALTRARYGCVIVGNPHTLKSNSMWASLIDHLHRQGLVVTRRTRGKSVKNIFEEV